jgi:hypothetical protein
MGLGSFGEEKNQTADPPVHRLVAVLTTFCDIQLLRGYLLSQCETKGCIDWGMQNFCTVKFGGSGFLVVTVM